MTKEIACLCEWHLCKRHQSSTHADISTGKPLVTFIEKFCSVQNEVRTPAAVLIRQMPSPGYMTECQALLLPSGDLIYSFTVIHDRPQHSLGCCTLSALYTFNLELKQGRKEPQRLQILDCEGQL